MEVRQTCGLVYRNFHFFKFRNLVFPVSIHKWVSLSHSNLIISAAVKDDGYSYPTENADGEEITVTVKAAGAEVKQYEKYAMALADLKAAECNALCVYLGNFGPEISETMLAQSFDGPVMFCAAAEEASDRLVGDRGDAYCGMLNASYNLKLRGFLWG